MDATELSGGSVYKILRRVERRDLVEGRWEAPEIAEAERRPRRRYYRLTRAGQAALDEALDRFRALTGDPLPEGGG
jgi:DNA-binding PadR family transcriptional regulator